MDNKETETWETLYDEELIDNKDINELTEDFDEFDIDEKRQGEISEEDLYKYLYDIDNNKITEEMPLVLVNFTKWSNGKIKFNIESQFIDSHELFIGLLKSLNDESVFTRMCEDLFERDMAFHTTSTQWKSDIKVLEQKHPGDFFQALSYPRVFGGFLTSEMWKKIKEKTEWKSVNILKCIYLAKTNRTLLYKHNMAVSLELLALEQKLLGQTAQRLKDEEEIEEKRLFKEYEERVQRKYEEENNNRILKSLSDQIFRSEGVVLPFTHQEVEEEKHYDNNDNDNDNNNNNQDDDQEDDQEDEDSYHSSDEEDADNELEFSDQRKKYQKKHKEEQDIKEIEEIKKKKELESKKLEEPPKPVMNVLDQIIAMIFSKILIENDNEKAQHYQSLHKMQQSIKETWIEEFGCLPPNCLWREDVSTLQ